MATLNDSYNPTQPWKSTTMDYIFRALKFLQGNDQIWVIVDRFSKQAHFIPCLKILKGFGAARLFIQYIFVHHGLPSEILSNCDPRFTGSFRRTLFDKLDTTLKFSFAYHSRMDYQIEIGNVTLLDMLKSYVSDQ